MIHCIACVPRPLEADACFRRDSLDTMSFLCVFLDHSDMSVALANLQSR